MEVKDIDIKEGITLHLMKTDRFKTNYIIINILSKLERKNITKNALIPLVLRRGSQNYNTMKDISSKLEEMYGASFDANTDKIGNSSVMQFMMDTISDEYTLEESDILKDGIELIDDVLLNPLLEDGVFKKEYVEQEKMTLKELISSKINDKATYASERAIEEMYKDSPYGIYKYGYIEDLEYIDSVVLYNYYVELLKTAEIHIYISGNVDEKYVEELLKNDYSKISRDYKKTIDNNGFLPQDEQKEVIEHQNVTQGKLVLGYELESDNLKNEFYKMTVYSAILGGTASSKLFNNVREKKSLAYTIRSQYIKHKGALLVSAGIEIENYELAKECILKEIDDMTKGNITDTELNDAKVNLVTMYKSFNDSQASLIGWSLGQRILGADEQIDIVIEKVKSVTVADVVEVAQKLKPKIAYFLTK